MELETTLLLSSVIVYTTLIIRQTVQGIRASFGHKSMMKSATKKRTKHWIEITVHVGASDELAKTLQSITANTYRNVIIVLDGSQATTAERAYAREYIAKHPRKYLALQLSERTVLRSEKFREDRKTADISMYIYAGEELSKDSLPNINAQFVAKPLSGQLEVAVAPKHILNIEDLAAASSHVFGAHGNARLVMRTHGHQDQTVFASRIAISSHVPAQRHRLTLPLLCNLLFILAATLTASVFLFAYTWFGFTLLFLHATLQSETLKPSTKRSLLVCLVPAAVLLVPSTIAASLNYGKKHIRRWMPA